MLKIFGLALALALTIALASAPSMARVGKVCTLSTDCGAKEFCELAAGNVSRPAARPLRRRSNALSDNLRAGLRLQRQDFRQ